MPSASIAAALSNKAPATAITLFHPAMTTIDCAQHCGEKLSKREMCSERNLKLRPLTFPALAWTGSILSSNSRFVALMCAGHDIPLLRFVCASIPRDSEAATLSAFVCASTRGCLENSGRPSDQWRVDQMNSAVKTNPKPGFSSLC